MVVVWAQALSKVVAESEKPVEREVRELRPTLFEALGWHHWAIHERSLIMSSYPSDFGLLA
jgi:hypothetical protein